MPLHIRPRSEEPQDELTFTWRVFAGKMRVEQRSVGGGIQSLFLQPFAGGTLSHTYQPLRDQPNLFHTFAQLSSAEEIACFADTYGRLGLADTESYGHFCEAIDAWMEHVLAVRTATWVLDIVEEPTSAAKHIAPLIDWSLVEKNGLLGFYSTKNGLQPAPRGSTARHELGWIGESTALVLTDKGKSDVIVSSTRQFLAAAINRRLWQGVSPELVVSREKLVSRYTPSSLIAAIWLQVYRRAIGATRFRRCEYCGERMDVTGRRQNYKVHSSCSGRERKRRYRANRASDSQL